MIKQIYLILLCLFINNSNIYTASKTDKDATAKESSLKEKENPLIEAVKNEQLQRVKVLLGQEHFSPEILVQALKIAKQKGKKELVHLIYEYSPERKKVEEAIKEHFPAPIAAIIEEYARSKEPREIEEEFFKILEKHLDEEEKIKNQTIWLGYEPQEFRPLIFDDYFIKLNQLSNEEKIRILHLLEKLKQRHAPIYHIDQFNENLHKVFDKYLEESSKNVKELFDKLRILRQKHELLILIYKYLFFSLPEDDRKEIKHPSEFEKSYEKEFSDKNTDYEDYDYESEHEKSKKDKA